jgi:hypothetical protein
VSDGRNAGALDAPSRGDGASLHELRERSRFDGNQVVDYLSIPALPEASNRWIDSPPHLAEARSFAAQLVAAADSHEHIDRSHLLMDKVERLVERLNVDLHRPLT